MKKGRRRKGGTGYSKGMKSERKDRKGNKKESKKWENKGKRKKK